MRIIVVENNRKEEEGKKIDFLPFFTASLNVMEERNSKVIILSSSQVVTVTSTFRFYVLVARSQFEVCIHDHSCSSHDFRVFIV